QEAVERQRSEPKRKEAHKDRPRPLPGSKTLDGGRNRGDRERNEDSDHQARGAIERVDSGSPVRMVQIGIDTPSDRLPLLAATVVMMELDIVPQQPAEMRFQLPQLCFIQQHTTFVQDPFGRHASGEMPDGLLREFSDRPQELPHEKGRDDKKTKR